jgi:hypothetical protein
LAFFPPFLLFYTIIQIFLLSCKYPFFYIFPTNQIKRLLLGLHYSRRIEYKRINLFYSPALPSPQGGVREGVCEECRCDTDTLNRQALVNIPKKNLIGKSPIAITGNIGRDPLFWNISLISFQFSRAIPC